MPWSPSSHVGPLRKAILYSLFVCLLTGCARHVPEVAELIRKQAIEESVPHTWLPLAIKDGKTTKAEILLGLGVPSDQFEGERVLAYRLRLERDQGYVVVSPEFDFVFAPLRGQGKYGGYHLILVFDEGHVVQRHSLIKVE